MTDAKNVDTGALKQILEEGNCPPAETMFLLRDGAASPEASLRWGAHLKTCSRCRAELALLEDFEKAEVRPGEEADVRYIEERLSRSDWQPAAAGDAPAGSKASRLDWRPLLAIAALLLFAVVYLNFPGSPGPSIDEYSGQSPVLRSGRLELAQPLGEVGEAPAAFSWQGVDRAASYELVLEEVDGNVLWRARTGVTEAIAPEEVRAGFLAGKRLWWRVRALDEAGSVVADSGRQPFRVRSGGGEQ